MKSVFLFYLHILSKPFITLRRIQRDFTINVSGSSCKVSVILSRLQSNLDFLDRFSKNPQVSNFIKIHPVEPSFSMRTDRQIRQSQEAPENFGSK